MTVKIEINEEEMEAIIDMYDVACIEGTDTKLQAELVERIFRSMKTHG